MKLYLFVWAEDFDKGILISYYYSWAEIARMIKLWANPVQVYTVVEGEE